MSESKPDARPPRVTTELLNEIARRIVERFHPEKIILFGSHAWGGARADSDVDLLVIMESDRRPAQRSAEVSLQCRPRLLPMDILVRTPAEVEYRLGINDPFLRRIIQQGRTLYER
ncbi:MAG TPA: nucleotidyltransferase domain-containing protein [Firmicutes bacterium]|nr:nucleotidyltransferase domain-containing protein [Bacillota bacterium]